MKSENEAKFLYAPHLILYVSHHFGSDFEALPEVQIEPKIACSES